MEAAAILRESLDELGIPSTLQNFQRENITIDMIEMLSDNELSRLGVSTIGLRHKLKQLVKKKQTTNSSVQQQVATERRHLFSPYDSNRSRSGHGKISRRKEKTVTLHFLCLASRSQKLLPNATEKEILNKAGLGKKKISFKKSDSEKEVSEKLISSNTNELGESEGFPKLGEGGGFELLRSTQNCRELTIINCMWSALELQKNVNPQSTIYIRPIQKNLSTAPVCEQSPEISTTKEQCKTCGEYLPLKELRKHTENCHQDQDMNEEPATQLLPQEITTQPRTPQQETNVTVEEVAFFPGQEVYLDHQNEAPTMSDAALTVFEAATPSVIDLNVVHEETVTCIDIVNRIIDFCNMQNILDPVEILHKTQQEMVTGRPLEVIDVTQTSDGETNFIMVDRSNLLETAFDEIKAIVDVRKTIEVQFYGETAVDYGGPRKEFFRLIMQEIKEKYFDHGLRELLHEDYEVIGKIFALSILQNGKMPTFLEPDTIQRIFSEATENPCISSLRIGLEALGLYTICMKLPSFIYLFQKSSKPLTFRMLTTILKPQFSSEGSNNIAVEKKVYAAFLCYLREVASGRREHVSVCSVLQFVTGADEEPVLGFKIAPSIHFPEVEISFLPTANTCINCLQLPRPQPALDSNLPEDSKLFQIYDYAFANSYYGLR